MQQVIDDGPWSPLRIRIYRSLWLAGLVSNVGTFMHLAAAGWTMTTLTSSPTLISLVQASWAVPGFLLALHAGAFADRLDRRLFLIATQEVALVIAAVLGGLQAAGWMSPGALLAGTFLESVALTMAAPAFMALTPELVGPRHLAQALGLDAISRNAAQALGPAVAGAVIAAISPGAVFLLNAASFVGVLFVVRAYRPAPRERAAHGALNGAIRDGLRHVFHAGSLRSPVARLAVMSAVGAALTALLPVVATVRLHVGAGGFGLLSAALGVGSVVAVWSLPRLGAARRPEFALLSSAVVWAAGAALLATVTHVWAAVAALLLAGAGTMGTLNVLFSNYTLQLPSWMRGRGSALAMLMVWLGASVGAVGWGAVASASGVRTALLAAAVANVIVALVARVGLPVSVARPDDAPLPPAQPADGSVSAADSTPGS